MINELVGSPTRSENVYFANNEQASIAVFTAVFCFTHAKHHLIKLKLAYRKTRTQYSRGPWRTQDPRGPRTLGVRTLEYPGSLMIQDS